MHVQALDAGSPCSDTQNFHRIMLTVRWLTAGPYECFVAYDFAWLIAMTPLAVHRKTKLIAAEYADMVLDLKLAVVMLDVIDRILSRELREAHALRSDPQPLLPGALMLRALSPHGRMVRALLPSSELLQACIVGNTSSEELSLPLQPADCPGYHANATRPPLC